LVNMIFSIFHITCNSNDKYKLVDSVDIMLTFLGFHRVRIPPTKFWL
jgi:hypothetical protein